MRYFTSDLHLFHNLILKKYRKSFSNFSEMHEDIIKKWNKKVRTKDTVYIIGDLSFGKYEETKEVISKLNGIKILIRGNHDERFSTKALLSMGIDEVRDTLVIKKDGQKWILNHYPYSSNFKHLFYKLYNLYFHKKNESNYYKLYLSYKGYKLIHGHHHSGPNYKFDQVNVAWDVNGDLLDENQIKEMFDKKINILTKIKEWFKLFLW